MDNGRSVNVLEVLRRLFRPPVFPDEELTRIAGLLHWMLLTLAVVNIFDMLILLVFAPETLPTFWLNAVFLAITGTAYWMTRSGWVRSAGYLVCLTFWVLLVWYVAISGGVTSPAFGLFSVVIVVPAVLVGTRGAVVFGLLSIGSAVVIYLAGNSGWLSSLEAAPTPSRLFATETSILVILILLIVIGSRSVWTSLTRARAGERALAERNRDLQLEIVRREQAQQQEARLAAILEATSDLAGISDVQGKMLYLNRAGRRMVGVAEDADIVQTVIADYHNPTVTDLIMNQAIPAAMKVGTWSGETLLLGRNGREIPVSQVIIAHRGRDGEIKFLSTVMRDISDRKQAEQQRLELVREEERLASFKEFLGTISHDLKTPMTVALTSLELLERLDDPQLRQEKIENIRRQMDLLNKYIQDLLLLTRLDRLPDPTFARLDLSALLREVETRITPAAEQRGLVLRIRCDRMLPAIQGEENDVHRALVNLIENAIHYTPAGGSVTVTASSDEANVLIEVADTGIGIDPQELMHIFARFYRSKQAQNMRSGGTGLGLAIVKRIVEVHGGTIDVNSAPGQGTTFRISLPRAAT